MSSVKLNHQYSNKEKLIHSFGKLEMALDQLKDRVQDVYEKK
ncbi:hypothetical protein [Alkalibacillus aidingensis]|nr:hypothetical protein [Alkalibacillus aidingensis]